MYTGTVYEMEVREVMYTLRTVGSILRRIYDKLEHFYHIANGDYL